MPNIFYLSKNPSICARQLCDKHVVKMVTETAQLLYTCLWLSFKDKGWIETAPLNKQGAKGYKVMFPKHPCVRWLLQSKSNYKWLVLYGKQLCKQYSHRYERTHFCQQHIEWLQNIDPNLDDVGFTQPKQAMPNQYKHKETIKAYRQYYINSKRKFAKWTKRAPPKWFQTENIDHLEI